MRLRLSIACIPMLTALGTASCVTHRPVAAPAMTPAGVQFVLLAPEAKSVALAGTFNEWSVSSHPFARGATPGLWTIVVRLPPGEHHFMYVVDGTRWLTPPSAEEYVDDGFGSRNGVVVVRPDKR